MPRYSTFATTTPIMLIQRFKGKIHRATVTEANLNYVGSITIDGLLLDAAGILEGREGPDR